MPQKQKQFEINPSLKKFEEKTARGKIFPIVIEETPKGGPVEIYKKLPGKRKFLLESADLPGKKEEKSRFSFLGNKPDAEAIFTTKKTYFNGFTKNGEKIKELREKNEKKDLYSNIRQYFPEKLDLNIADSGRQFFTGGAVGFINYEAVFPYIKGKKIEEEIVLGKFFFTSEVVVFDHKENKVKIIETPITKDPRKTYRKAVKRGLDKIKLIKSVEKENYNLTGKNEINLLNETDTEVFKTGVKELKRHIFEGNLFQAVLSRKKIFEKTCEPFDLYRALRKINPSPYMYIIEDKEEAVVGASPEKLVSIHGDEVNVNPIAGTRRRGKDEKKDEKLAKEMVNDEKERAEHIMLVDLGRNDVRKVSKPGSVEVTDYLDVIRYSHVQHLESKVKGKLEKQKDAFDAFKATFPAGTVSGAPKVRSIKIIDKLEPFNRGTYAGGVGYFTWNKDSDFAIVIRTAVFKENKITIQAGAGIVQDSKPERELEETGEKMEAVIAALKEASN